MSDELDSFAKWFSYHGYEPEELSSCETMDGEDHFTYMDTVTPALHLWNEKFKQIQSLKQENEKLLDLCKIKDEQIRKLRRELGEIK